MTSAEIEGTGQYRVNIDTSQIPTGKLGDCVPMVSNVSGDAAFPLKGEISAPTNGIPNDALLVIFRDSAGNLDDLETGGGSNGFSIALFC